MNNFAWVISGKTGLCILAVFVLLAIIRIASFEIIWNCLLVFMGGIVTGYALILMNKIVSQLNVRR